MKRLRFEWAWFLQGIVLLVIMGVSAPAQQIAFTWDDLPAHSTLPLGETRVEISRKLIAAMKDAQMPPVYGFVNGVRTEEEPLSTPMLANWRSAGLLLGNHTWSHMNLNQSSLAAWEADVLKNEELLQSGMEDADWHWLRYPNPGEGDTERSVGRAPLLAERVRACWRHHEPMIMPTMPYARCVAKNDTAAITELEAAHLAAADAASTIAGDVEGLVWADIPYGC
jgi:peptidoglycan/xylan/chitin deacetylase (PgdA/CDA1 family)